MADRPAPTDESRALAAALDAAMERYATGDESAFTEVYRLAGPRLHSFCLRLTRRRGDADDLFQETFLKLHRARASYLPGSAPMNWVFAIARSTHIDRMRHKKRRPEDLTETSDLFATYTSLSGFAGEVGASPESSAAAQELVRVLERALDEIPENQRTAFVLLKEEGLSVADAAAVLGTTVTAVKLRAHRAYEAIREAFEGAGYARGEKR